MTKTIYRSVTAKRRTSRPKSKRAGSASAGLSSAAPFVGMMARLNRASATLNLARRGR